MTLPDERYRAVQQTQKFLLELLQTPRVAKNIKDSARACLRHFPTELDMHRAAEACPDIFQDRMEDLYRFIAVGSRSAADFLIDDNHEGSTPD